MYKFKSGKKWDDNVKLQGLVLGVELNVKYHGAGVLRLAFF